MPSSLAPDATALPPLQRVRVRYRKVGPARFLGGRELGTVFLRAARRAALPVAFSQGHHPLPKLGFGPALPVGTSSDDEYVDIELTAIVAVDDVRSRLAAQLPEGLEPIEALELPRSAPSIEQSIESFAYEVGLDQLDAPPAPERVAAAVAGFADATSFPVRKHAKGGERIVDACRWVRRLAVTAPGRLALEITAGQDGTLKPELFLGELLTLEPTERPVLRVHKVATRFRTAAAAGA